MKMSYPAAAQENRCVEMSDAVTIFLPWVPEFFFFLLLKPLSLSGEAWRSFSISLTTTVASPLPEFGFKERKPSNHQEGDIGVCGIAVLRYWPIFHAVFR